MAPDVLDDATAQAQQSLEAQKHGYLSVCDASLDRHRVAFGPLTTATAALAFEPVDLSGTPFTRVTSLGAKSERVNDVRSRLFR